jgi:hypothetical protein
VFSRFKAHLFAVHRINTENHRQILQVTEKVNR